MTLLDGMSEQVYWPKLLKEMESFRKASYENPNYLSTQITLPLRTYPIETLVFKNILKDAHFNIFHTGKKLKQSGYLTTEKKLHNSGDYQMEYYKVIKCNKL
jgi:hypothetical protein